MIIALESASTDPSVAVARPDGTLLAVEGWSAQRRLASDLLPHLLDLLAREGIGLERASAVAVGVGPGSFTGLRVGMSLAKGLSLALAIPIVGVASLAAWLDAEPGAHAALARAGAHDAYLLERGGGEPAIVTREQLAARGGSGMVVAPAELAAAFEIPAWQPPMRAAGAVAAKAALRLAADPTGDDLERLEPGYQRQPRGIGPSGEAA
jgi:tRNA threonylcarbamoyl adenosine modification protein YeaZ